MTIGLKLFLAQKQPGKRFSRIKALGGKKTLTEIVMDSHVGNSMETRWSSATTRYG